MNNKVLINIFVPAIQTYYNAYIPINKKVGTIKNYILKSINEISGGYLELSNNYIFLDRDTGIEYDNNLYIKDTNIRNGSKLIII